MSYVIKICHSFVSACSRLPKTHITYTGSKQWANQLDDYFPKPAAVVQVNVFMQSI